MFRQIDYTLLDQPHILQYIFYPRKEWTKAPLGATDHAVAVGEGVSIVCRLYLTEQNAPTFVYFHGNGEVVSDYDWIAPVYHSQGINLFVADYRGYGRSTGSPSFATMTADARTILQSLLALRRANGHSGPLFVMGRSLGSHSALELAAHYPEIFRGLIIESGFASPARLLNLLGPAVSQAQIRTLEQAAVDRMKAITQPILILHGEYDSLIPPEQAQILYDNIGSPDKTLVIIPGAEHNDIMLVGGERYFGAIRDFVQSHAA